ncbi:MAG: hypothetical protein MZU95_05545 [Desulfomicrobium escambiense]|nr:hypothetical protein [Desulfomicrobium escambiense]
MSDERFQSLLRELFQGHADHLRRLLQPLTAQQRALFEQFDELFKVLRRACRYEQDARPAKLSQLYEAIRDDPVAFLRDQATTLAAPGALNNPRVFEQRSYDSLMEFYSRLQLLQAGLAGKSGAPSAFKFTSQHPVRTQGFILNAGRILMDRPEPWVPEVLARVFENLHRWLRFAGGDQGVARLMREARQQHPEWADTLAPWLGMAMRHDGFFTRSLFGFDAAMILAGLEYEPSEQESVFEPLMDPKIVEALLRRMSDGSLPRADLIALTLRKLQGPLRPSIARSLDRAVRATGADRHRNPGSCRGVRHPAQRSRASRQQAGVRRCGATFSGGCRPGGRAGGGAGLRAAKPGAGARQSGPASAQEAGQIPS